MKLAIIGYGRMGHEIETVALERGHSIALTIDKDNLHDLNPDNLKGIDVAIEFTTPETAFNNVKACLMAGIPVVSGTTGWLEKLPEAKEIAEKGNGALFFASNFSVGVNLFFKINRIMARYIKMFSGYNIEIEEIHHVQKKDAPSGTAITLANLIAEELSGIEGWTLLPETQAGKIPISALREGAVPGTHSVMYSSQQDEIILTHRAKSRRGFALGAILAAEYAFGKKGFLTMDSLLRME